MILEGTSQHPPCSTYFPASAPATSNTKPLRRAIAVLAVVSLRWSRETWNLPVHDNKKRQPSFQSFQVNHFQLKLGGKLVKLVGIGQDTSSQVILSFLMFSSPKAQGYTGHKQVEARGCGGALGEPWALKSLRDGVVSTARWPCKKASENGRQKSQWKWYKILQDCSIQYHI